MAGPAERTEIAQRWRRTGTHPRTHYNALLKDKRWFHGNGRSLDRKTL